jgi:Tol biopolymer transport system component
MALRFVVAVVFAALVLSGGLASAAPRYSDWSAPVNLGAVINSGSDDSGPALSKDGLSLYFTSTRPGGFGSEDIWISQRMSTDGPWGAPTNLGPVINTTANERVPNFSRDGHWIFFGSNRTGSVGGFDIWASWRPFVHEDFGWQTPINLGPGVNTSLVENGPSFLETEEGNAFLYFTRNRVGNPTDFDIYVSVRQADGSWGAASAVAELNSPANDARPAVRLDGLEIIFHSFRTGDFDLYVATRSSTADHWTGVTSLSSVNTAFLDAQPAISADRETLFFTSGRPGGSGGGDLYMSTRTKAHGAP